MGVESLHQSNRISFAYLGVNLLSEQSHSVALVHPLDFDGFSLMSLYFKASLVPRIPFGSLSTIAPGLVPVYAMSSRKRANFSLSKIQW